MLAAGTGIAPMLQVIQGILSDEDDETFIHLVYSSRTYEDILMKHSLDEMKAYWNFSVLYVVSKVSSSSKLTEFEYCNLKHRVIPDRVKFVFSFYSIVFFRIFFYNTITNRIFPHLHKYMYMICTCTWILYVNTCRIVQFWKISILPVPPQKGLKFSLRHRAVNYEDCSEGIFAGHLSASLRLSMPFLLSLRLPSFQKGGSGNRFFFFNVAWSSI